MNKFLFTDGLNGVIKQTDSAEELATWIDASTDPDKIRIWVYNKTEWISLATYRKQYPPVIRKPKSLPVQPVANRSMHWTKKLLITTAAAAGVFLVFNFTRIKWESATPLAASAARPANMPEMDIDSLITEIEYERGQTLDRSTRTNLRLRNTWPDRILLQVAAQKETSTAGNRFYDVNITIDNTTGFALDQAIVRLWAWKNNKASLHDTLHFRNIRFDKLANRLIEERIKADSISVDFQSIRAKAFNFSYSSKLSNEPGAYTDRWFNKD
jgi:hypothetical protein